MVVLHSGLNNNTGYGPTLTRRQRLNWLRMRSPSLFRSTILMWLLNAFGTVLGILFILLSVLLALNASAGQKMLQWLISVPADDQILLLCKQPDTTRINWAFCIAAAAIGILCLVIAKLSRKVNRRSWHIAELEAVADEEDDETPGGEKLQGDKEKR
jgi:hypothetical protein